MKSIKRATVTVLLCVGVSGCVALPYAATLVGARLAGGAIANSVEDQPEITFSTATQADTFPSQAGSIAVYPTGMDDRLSTGLADRLQEAGLDVITPQKIMTESTHGGFQFANFQSLTKQDKIDLLQDAGKRHDANVLVLVEVKAQKIGENGFNYLFMNYNHPKTFGNLQIYSRKEQKFIYNEDFEFSIENNLARANFYNSEVQDNLGHQLGDRLLQIMEESGEKEI